MLSRAAAANHEGAPLVAADADAGTAVSRRPMTRQPRGRREFFQ